jgi:hypothetical protein
MQWDLDREVMAGGGDLDVLAQQPVGGLPGDVDDLMAGVAVEDVASVAALDVADRTAF